MSYKFITQYDSPNFTPGNKGRKMIIIHWWDDPAKNPSFMGTINTLINPSRGASAHFVATGTDRQVACLVNLEDTAWHAGTSNPATNPNPISIGIEADPRCRPEDYDVVAELIANIRSAYGDLPLKGHRDFVPTQCPGNWDLVRLDKLARTKDGSQDWGIVTDIRPPVVIPEPPVVVPQPPVVIEPPVVEEPVVEPEKPIEEPVEKPNLLQLIIELIKSILKLLTRKG
jgi:hypothetical protein